MYFNREHHRLSRHWNWSCRCLGNNSLGFTNNITESAIRLHQQYMTGKFKRFDHLLRYLLKFMENQEQKLKFYSLKKNDTTKQLENRLEGCPSASRPSFVDRNLGTHTFAGDSQFLNHLHSFFHRSRSRVEEGEASD